MKIPRVNDFDPDAKVPTLKSSLDNMPSILKPKPEDEKRAQSSSPLPINPDKHLKKTIKVAKDTEIPKEDIRDVRPVHPVLPVRPVPQKRVMKQRWPVDIYQDQYESLQRLALEERMRGGIGSMSAMIREALDKLIAEKKST